MTHHRQTPDHENLCGSDDALVVDYAHEVTCADCLASMAHNEITRTLADHYPAEDWHCSCGEDLFGGSAGYSLTLYRSHVASNILAVLPGRS